MKIATAKGIVKLSNLKSGTLFQFRDVIAVKSEYRNNDGACECYIVGSGEMFWGGTRTAQELNNLFVNPLLIIKEV